MRTRQRAADNQALLWKANARADEAEARVKELEWEVDNVVATTAVGGYVFSVPDGACIGPVRLTPTLPCIGTVAVTAFRARLQEAENRAEEAEAEHQDYGIDYYAQKFRAEKAEALLSRCREGLESIANIAARPGVVEIANAILSDLEEAT